MERQKTDARWLVVTAVLTVLLGVQTLKDIFSDDGIIVPTVARIAGTRQPASLQSEFSPPSVLPRKEMMVRWNCKDKGLPDKVMITADQFRLKGSGCGVSGEQFTVVNESNGFTASVFAIGKDGFETDLIQLNSGENHLHLKAIDGHKMPRDISWTVFSSPNELKSHR